jgi:hypothetical protein
MTPLPHPVAALRSLLHPLHGNGHAVLLAERTFAFRSSQEPPP